MMSEKSTANAQPWSFRLLRLAIWLGAAGFLLWLGIQYTGIAGVTTIRSSFEGNSNILRIEDPSQLHSVQALSGQWVQEFDGQQLRLSIRPSVAYEELRLRLRFQNDGKPNVLLNPQTRLDLDPVQIPVKSDALDSLTWDVLDNGTLRLWQKEKRFNSIDEFLASTDHPNLALAWYEPQIAEIRSDLGSPRVYPDLSGTHVTPLKVDELLAYDEVLSTYRPPIPDGDWSVAELALHLPQLYVNDNRFFFSLLASTNEQSEGRVLLDWLQMSFRKDPLTPASLFNKVTGK